jgi:hypothetical protein
MSNDNFSKAMAMDKYGMYGKTRKRRGNYAEAPKTSPGRDYANELQYRTEYESYRKPKKSSKRRSAKR